MTLFFLVIAFVVVTVILVAINLFILFGESAIETPGVVAITDILLIITWVVLCDTLINY
ncbi:hypothetical protein [Bacillus wiedmannii]|uniref:hypothetical protein n=1 Tax=Bacillus wiedmannii TaxID=1890302 RepID=UPI001482D453|nr:hypothetical protein [Bacillus wiedmannii]